jgi:hypothetical protein
MIYSFMIFHMLSSTAPTAVTTKLCNCHIVVLIYYHTKQHMPIEVLVLLPPCSNDCQVDITDC